jgi:hypothetical protein
MKAHEKFFDLPNNFWALVRLVSQEVGYSDRKTKGVKVPSVEEISKKLHRFDIDYDRLKTQHIEFGNLFLEYFSYRAEVLNQYVQPRLMDAERAQATFEEHRQRLNPSCPLPMNKQTGDKKAPAYLTGLVNMLVEENAQGHSCDYDPQKLTTITHNGMPVRTLARRVDGAFPSSHNPVAIWEIKEYYYTTTFGSRIADGIYETLLDGLELQELRTTEGIDIKHYLIVDARDTWWKLGKSYLCRIIDMLHMGLLDEALFGYEVVERLPGLVKEWLNN